MELRRDAAPLDLLGLQHAPEDLAAAPFAVGQRSLGGDAIGHVHEHAPDVVDLVRPVPDREHRHEVRLAVPSDLQAGDRLARLEHLVDRGESARIGVGNGVGEPHADVLRLNPPQPLDGAVHADDTELAVVHDHSERRGLEDGAQDALVRACRAVRDRGDHRDDEPLAAHLDAVEVQVGEDTAPRRLELALLVMAPAAPRESRDHPVQPVAVADSEIGGRSPEQLFPRLSDQVAEAVAHVDERGVAHPRDHHSLLGLGHIRRQRGPGRSRRDHSHHAVAIGVPPPWADCKNHPTRRERS